MITWDRFPSKHYNENSSLPFIEQVIDSLLKHFPETVIRIDDLLEYSIYNSRELSTPPSIIIL